MEKIRRDLHSGVDGKRKADYKKAKCKFKILSENRSIQEVFIKSPDF